MSATVVRMLHILAEDLQGVILQRQYCRCPGLLFEREVLVRRLNHEYVRLIKEVDRPKTGREPCGLLQTRKEPMLEWRAYPQRG